jgi:hypothetical protein
MTGELKERRCGCTEGRRRRRRRRMASDGL